MNPRFQSPDYERIEASLEAQQMTDDDMWEAMAKELEHHHKPVRLSTQPIHTEGASDNV